MGKWGPDNPQWKGDDAQKHVKRERAQRRYPLGRCEWRGCTKMATDRHHVNGDTGNNDPDNIQRYCRKHHMMADVRLKNLIENGIAAGRRRATDAKPCASCGRPWKPLRRGMCNRCYERKRRAAKHLTKLNEILEREGG